ncbi:MAG: hypothetical protein M3O61_08255 [Gemmatimonadota bacterium]|nr:hypothetical protein [Gemmatimonadota bacterium]
MSASRDRLVVTETQLFRRTPVLLAFVLACNSEEPAGPSRSQPQMRLRIEAMSPTELKGTVARAVQPTPSIVVLDQANKPVSGVKVNFTLNPQNSAGSIQFDTVVTNSNGMATAGEWVLGKGAFPQTLRVWIAEPAASITFTALALPDSAAHLRSVILFSSKLGLPNDTVQASGRVADRFGNGVAGVLVTFTVTAGGGSLAQTQASTEQYGQVSVPWILGSTVGLNAIMASSAGVDGFVDTVQTISLERPTFYDLEEIAGGLPHMRFVETGFIALEETGRFLDSYTGTRGYGMEGVWRSTGRYEISGTKVLLIYPELTEEVSISGDYLLVSRFDPNTYNCCVIWKYKKRNVS